jgi:hypothetical protein
MREVVVDLAAHALDLRRHRGRQFRVSGSRHPLGVSRQHGERRFQAVRQVAGLGERTLHPLVALGQQRVEVVHQRLHFGGVVTAHPTMLTAVHCGKARVQERHRLQAAADLPHAGRHRERGPGQHGAHVGAGEPVVHLEMWDRIPREQVHGEDADGKEQPERP